MVVSPKLPYSALNSAVEEFQIKFSCREGGLVEAGQNILLTVC